MTDINSRLGVGSGYFHVTPFGEEVAEHGLRTPDSVALNPLEELVHHVHAGALAEAALRLDVAKRDGRAYDWAVPVEDPNDLRIINNIFAPATKGARGVCFYRRFTLMGEDSPYEGETAAVGLAPFGERIGLMIRSIGVAAKTLERTGEDTQARILRAATDEILFEKYGVDVNNLPKVAEMTVFELLEDGIEESEIIQTKSIASIEYRALGSVSPQHLRKDKKFEVPIEKTRLGQYAHGSYSDDEGIAFWLR